MTKRDFASLLIAFLGGFLMYQAFVGLLAPIATFPGAYSIGSKEHLLFFAMATLQPLIYAGMATLVIRKSGFFAARLLRGARIAADEKIEVGISADAFPIMISLVGLFFISTQLPNFAIAAGKLFLWAAQEPNTILGGPDKYISALRSEMIYEALYVALSAFVFLRADLLVGLANRYRTRPHQPLQGTPAEASSSSTESEGRRS